MNTDKIYADSIAKEYAPKEHSKILRHFKHGSLCGVSYEEREWIFDEVRGNHADIDFIDACGNGHSCHRS